MLMLPHERWECLLHVRVNNAVCFKLVKGERNLSFDGNPLTACLVSNLICLPDSLLLHGCCWRQVKIIRDKLVDKQDV